MPRPPTRRSRPSLERLESLDLPSAMPLAAAPAPAFRIVNLASTPIAAGLKTYLAASAPPQGRRRGTVDSFAVAPDAGLVAGVMTVDYRVKILPSFLTPFSPSVSFAMRVQFVTSLDDPRPGDVAVTYTKNVVPFGGTVRARVAQGIVAFLRHDRAAIAAIGKA